jgi:hypothetical protein
VLTLADQVSLGDLDAAMRTEAALSRFYPGHPWAASKDGPRLHCLLISASGQWGYTIDLYPTMTEAELVRQIKQAGGELLERFGIARGLAGRGQSPGVDRDFAGNFIPDR